MPDCSIEGCENHIYAKELCHKHYQAKWFSGNPLGKLTKRCEYPDCNRKTSNKEYCALCQKKVNVRKKHNLPLDFKNCSIFQGLKQGVDNPNWKGGISQYRNHSLMKKNRLIKIKETKGLCEICGESGKHIHHIDETKNNHTLDNLIFLCVPCHKKLHPNKTTKYSIEYGFTISEIALNLNCSIANVSKLHKSGKLKNIINSTYE